MATPICNTVDVTILQKTVTPPRRPVATRIPRHRTVKKKKKESHHKCEVHYYKKPSLKKSDHARRTFEALWCTLEIF